MSDGNEEYVCAGLAKRVAKFRSKSAAKWQADFISQGLDEGDIAKVVKFPSLAKLKADGYAV